MADPTLEIESQALKLPIKARALLPRRLISSLDGVADEDCERFWIEEAKRRLDELKSGKVAGVPADQVFAELRSALR